jgi:hypothetical protein
MRMTSTADTKLARMQFAAAISACVDQGDELRPLPSVDYKVFAVHAVLDDGGSLRALAIGHRRGDRFVIDLCKANVPLSECHAALNRFGVWDVTLAPGDEADAVEHAVAGVVYELRPR